MVHSVKPVNKDMLGITGEAAGKPKSRGHQTSYRSIRVSTANLHIPKMMNRTGFSHQTSLEATTVVDSNQLMSPLSSDRNIA